MTFQEPLQLIVCFMLGSFAPELLFLHHVISPSSRATDVRAKPTLRHKLLVTPPHKPRRHRYRIPCHTLTLNPNRAVPSISSCAVLAVSCDVIVMATGGRRAITLTLALTLTGGRRDRTASFEATTAVFSNE